LSARRAPNPRFRVSVRRASNRRLRAPWIIFWAGILLRVLYITLAHTYRLRPYQDHFAFGWEMGRIARALVTGYGYADPFVGHTGPTAWVPPLYPLLLAGVFKLFGVYTAKSAWVILALNSVFSAATAVFIYEIGARCYNRKVALWSAWLWALYPAAMQYAVHWIWDMALTTMLFAWVLALALRMRGIGDDDSSRTQSSVGQWLAFGLLWGLIGLSNPSLLLFLPVCGIWILLGSRPLGRAILHAALAAVVFLALLGSWTWRNWRAFHAFVPIRTNFGAELYAGDGPGSNGFAFMATLPLIGRDPQTMRYKAMGEIAYVHQQGVDAEAYIAARPAHFALISLKRFYFFWIGVPHPAEAHPAAEFFRELDYSFLSLAGLLGLALSLRGGAPAAGLFAWAFLLLPLVYYFVSVAARFRHPLEPLIAIFAVYIFQSAQKRKVRA
jgi:4-amino-4-deoxy-L-arabinose transferase-like glycosyltransferase